LKKCPSEQITRHVGRKIIKALLFNVLVIPMLAASMCCFGTVQSAHAKENSRPISAWPLIYHRAEKERAEADVLWPLFHYERENERTRYALRPFLFSTESDPKEDSRKTSLLWQRTVRKCVNRWHRLWRRIFWAHC